MMPGGVLPPNMGQGGNGLLPFDMPTNPVDVNRNAVLGYLAGALQGGNLGQSIGRGLQGWLSGAQTDATEQARHAAAQYVAQQPDIDSGMRSVLMQNPALAMQYLQARLRPRTTRDIAEFEYAKRQGYAGSFADFIRRKPPGAPAEE
jgi:hypothetical protein